MTIARLNSIKKLRRDIDAVKFRITQETSAATSCVSGGWRRKTVKAEDGKTERCTVLEGASRSPGSISDKVGNAAVNITELKKELAVLERRRGRLIAYIHGIKDIYIREAMIQHFEKEKTWETVALKFGGGNTGDGVRRAVERFLRRGK